MEDQYFGNGVTDEFDDEFELDEYQPDAFYLSLKAALQLLAREAQAASSVAA
ncbi:MAG: hypothetical protein R3E82_08025 [Pseudomonadales bacterium]|nr:hypothetical protein [Pseudomonadales bacterium]